MKRIAFAAVTALLVSVLGAGAAHATPSSIWDSSSPMSSIWQ
ncbi:hypothetical protein [Streptomyces calidiresistens]|nr:hypothetical protein [Streptomyces calidiresistens]